MILKCDVCNQNKEETKRVKTLRGTFITSCLPCEKELKRTVACLKLDKTADWQKQVYGMG